MKSDKSSTQSNRRAPRRWLVLLPHRDSLKQVQDCKSRAWVHGLPGFRSLPPLVYIASVPAPLPHSILKLLASDIRRQSSSAHSGGWIQSSEAVIRHIPGFPPLAGLSLSVRLLQHNLSPEILPWLTDPVVSGPSSFEITPFLVLGPLPSPAEAAQFQSLASERLPLVKFRQAALANMAIVPLASSAPGYSYLWEIGKPSWMARHG
ncbi:MAG: hypothetical protein SNJ56_03820 [Termitinemataceae bacterium]